MKRKLTRTPGQQRQLEASLARLETVKDRMPRSAYLYQKRMLPVLYSDERVVFTLGVPDDDAE